MKLSPVTCRLGERLPATNCEFRKLAVMEAVPEKTRSVMFRSGSENLNSVDRWVFA
jgi:hypothetical protein